MSGNFTFVPSSLERLFLRQMKAATSRSSNTNVGAAKRQFFARSCRKNITVPSDFECDNQSLSKCVIQTFPRAQAQARKFSGATRPNAGCRTTAANIRGGLVVPTLEHWLKHSLL